MRNSELKITSAKVSVVQYMVDISPSYEGSSISVIPIKEGWRLSRYNLKNDLKKCLKKMRIHVKVFVLQL